MLEDCDKFGVGMVYSQDDVLAAYRRLADSIVKSVKDKDGVTMLMILKGGVFTGFGILDKMNPSLSKLNVRIGFVGYSSYDGVRQGDTVERTYGLDLPTGDCIEDRHVWIVDDIFDTGRTMEAAEQYVKCFKPKVVNTCTLVYRLRDTQRKRKPTATGLVYEGKEFLIGCGMGLNEEYRCLTSIYKVILKESKDEAD